MSGCKKAICYTRRMSKAQGKKQKMPAERDWRRTEEEIREISEYITDREYVHAFLERDILVLKGKHMETLLLLDRMSLAEEERRRHERNAEEIGTQIAGLEKRFADAQAALATQRARIERLRAAWRSLCAKREKICRKRN